MSMYTLEEFVGKRTVEAENFDGKGNNLYNMWIETSEPIIRCKNCRYFDEKGIFHDWWCNRLGISPSKESFCSFGVKRDD